MKIREHGIQARERSRVYTQKPKCSLGNQNFESVRMSDCYAAFMVLVYGFAASFGIFLIENLVKLNEKCRNFSQFLPE